MRLSLFTAPLVLAFSFYPAQAETPLPPPEAAMIATSLQRVIVPAEGEDGFAIVENLIGKDDVSVTLTDGEIQIRRDTNAQADPRALMLPILAAISYGRVVDAASMGPVVGQLTELMIAIHTRGEASPPEINIDPGPPLRASMDSASGTIEIAVPITNGFTALETTETTGRVSGGTTTTPVEAIYHQEDGRAVIRWVGNRRDLGSWRVDADGLYCLTRQAEASEECYRFYQMANGSFVRVSATPYDTPSSFLGSDLSFAAGNPEDLQAGK